VSVAPDENMVHVLWDSGMVAPIPFADSRNFQDHMIECVARFAETDESHVFGHVMSLARAAVTSLLVYMPSELLSEAEDTTKTLRRMLDESESAENLRHAVIHLARHIEAAAFTDTPYQRSQFVSYCVQAFRGTGMEDVMSLVATMEAGLPEIAFAGKGAEVWTAQVAPAWRAAVFKLGGRVRLPNSVTPQQAPLDGSSDSYVVGSNNEDA
jgi:hypothetical protein